MPEFNGEKVRGREKRGGRTDNLVSKGAADGVLVSGYLRLPSSCASLAASWPSRRPLRRTTLLLYPPADHPPP